ncbi:hypothetical protein ACIREE_03380 [Streptomyces sp. NPDC102467]|uniref:hypothetical protein n=1 Tax=Streptomyces sp. NPDC102467 TaxID=3366179 RepID=UPI00380F8899
MNEAHDAVELPAPLTRAESALDSLLARYETRIQQHGRAAAPDAGRHEQLLAERQELLTDKSLLSGLSDEQLVQVTAIYETRNDALDSSQPDAQ